jgi:GNAT superfamily N-acetyltransferase
VTKRSIRDRSGELRLFRCMSQIIGTSQFVNLAIRKATVEDAFAIAELASELGYPATHDAMCQRLVAILGKSDHLILVAIYNDKTLAAWIQAHSADFIESGLRVDIVGLVVAQTMRRRGIGRLLVGQVEQWAAAINCDVVAVRSNIKRVESHLFYPALGYQSVKTQLAYRKRLKDGV